MFIPFGVHQREGWFELLLTYAHVLPIERFHLRELVAADGRELETMNNALPPVMSPATLRR